MQHRKRRERPPVLEWTVFALAAFLALFLVYEVAKRRVKPPQPVAAPIDVPPVSLVPERAAPVAPSNQPPERLGKGTIAPLRTENLKAKRPATVIPAPPR